MIKKIIVIIIIILILGSAGFYYYGKYLTNSPSTPSQQSYTPSKPLKNDPTITAGRVQAILQKSTEITDLPDSSKILLIFWDNDGASLSNRYFVTGGGSMKNYGGEEYDLKIETGAYYIPQLEQASDFCSEFRKIKDAQDVRLTINSKLSL